MWLVPYETEDVVVRAYRDSPYRDVLGALSSEFASILLMVELMEEQILLAEGYPAESYGIESVLNEERVAASDWEKIPNYVVDTTWD